MTKRIHKHKELILQSIALIFVNVIALVHDKEFVSLAYIIDGMILGINIKGMFS